MFFKTEFNTLPYDIKQLILSELEDEKDLLHLGLANKGWKELVIPYHLEYRTLRLNKNRPEVWRHLAEKGHLAARIRTVILGQKFMCEQEKHELYAEFKEDMYPRALLDVSDKLPSRLVEGEVRKAFANMRSLDTFQWDGPGDRFQDCYREAPIPMAEVFEGLIKAKSVRSLSVRDPTSTFFGPRNKDFLHSAYPLWNICGLEKLLLDVYYPRDDGSEEHPPLNLLKNNISTLTVLRLNLLFVPADALGWTFPKLQAISLGTSLEGLSPPHRRLPWTFLANNPTIQHADVQISLDRHPMPQPSRFLPNLKTISLRGGDSDFMQSFLASSYASQRPLSSLSGLALSEDTMMILMGQRRALTSLEYLHITAVDHPSMLLKLGSVLPGLRVLEYRTRRRRPLVLDLDDFLSLVSGFEALRAVWGIVTCVTHELKGTLMDEVFRACPSLEVTVAGVVVGGSPTSSRPTFFRMYPLQKSWTKIKTDRDMFLYPTDILVSHGHYIRYLKSPFT